MQPGASAALRSPGCRPASPAVRTEHRSRAPPPPPPPPPPLPTRPPAPPPGGVADGPGRFLLDVELGGGQQVDERRHDARIHHRLQSAGGGGQGLARGQGLRVRARARCTAPRVLPTWICSLVPAVMLEMVQHASFLMLFLWLVVSRLSRQGSAPQLMMIWRQRGGQGRQGRRGERAVSTVHNQGVWSASGRAGRASGRRATDAGAWSGGGSARSPS